MVLFHFNKNMAKASDFNPTFVCSHQLTGALLGYDRHHKRETGNIHEFFASRIFALLFARYTLSLIAEKGKQYLRKSCAVEMALEEL